MVNVLVDGLCAVIHTVPVTPREISMNRLTPETKTRTGVSHEVTIFTIVTTVKGDVTIGDWKTPRLLNHQREISAAGGVDDLDATLEDFKKSALICDSVVHLPVSGPELVPQSVLSQCNNRRQELRSRGSSWTRTARQHPEATGRKAAGFDGDWKAAAGSRLSTKPRRLDARNLESSDNPLSA